MNLFFTVIAFVFVVIFVLCFLSAYFAEDFGTYERFGISAIVSFVAALIVTIVAALLMWIIIGVRTAKVSIKVAELNAEAEVLQYQLNQISEGEYLIEEQEAYKQVLRHNKEVAILHEKSLSKYYFWFYPKEYRDIKLVILP